MLGQRCPHPLPPVAILVFLRCDWVRAELPTCLLLGWSLRKPLISLCLVSKQELTDVTPKEMSQGCHYVVFGGSLQVKKVLTEGAPSPAWNECESQSMLMHSQLLCFFFWDQLKILCSHGSLEKMWLLHVLCTKKKKSRSRHEGPSPKKNAMGQWRKSQTDVTLRGS